MCISEVYFTLFYEVLFFFFLGKFTTEKEVDCFLKTGCKKGLLDFVEKVGAAEAKDSGYCSQEGQVKFMTLRSGICSL